jgi:hypothetical protein
LLDQTSSSPALVRVGPSHHSAAVRALIVAVVVALAVTAPALLVPRLASAHALAVDVTTTTKAQKSITYRKSVTLRQWRASKHGQAISYRESHNVCSAVSANGRYRGKWQMTQALWSAHGGLTFAKRPQGATCREQDRVARRIWVRSWWWPWGG